MRLADFCGASRMMLAKIRALRQFSFGCFVRRTRRMRTARKKRCAFPLLRSKELFQPDAQSDLPHLGPGLRPGRCGWVGSPEGLGRGNRNTLPGPLAPAEQKQPKKKSARLCGRSEGLYRFCKNVCRGRPVLAVSTFPAAFGPGRPDGPAPRRGR